MQHYVRLSGAVGRRAEGWGKSQALQLCGNFSTLMNRESIVYELAHFLAWTGCFMSGHGMYGR